MVLRPASFSAAVLAAVTPLPRLGRRAPAVRPCSCGKLGRRLPQCVQLLSPRPAARMFEIRIGAGVLIGALAVVADMHRGAGCRRCVQPPMPTAACARQAAATAMRQQRPAPRKNGLAGVNRHIAFLAAAVQRIGPGQMSHDNMSRKRLGRNPASHVRKHPIRAKRDDDRASDRRAISRQGPGTLRAEPGAHGRAGRQGGVRLGRAARKGRGARQRRRARRRHGQDLLQAHRILAVRSAARAGGADAAVRRLHDRLGQRHPARSRAAKRRTMRSSPSAATSAFRTPNGARNAFFDFLKQAYLVTSRWAADLVEHAEGLDEHTRHKAELLRQADLQRDLAVELHPDQSGAVPRNRRHQRRKPGARHEDAGRGHRRRQGRPEAAPGRLFAASRSARTSP